jgi:cysteine desulfurase/selenocysteine lyase
MNFDVEKIRADFPLLRQTMRGKPLVYLDNAATSQKPRQVLDVLQTYYERHNANVHRGIYEISEEATGCFEMARATVARFVNAAEPAEIIFTRNATEAINLVARTWGDANLHAGDTILLTQMEHHSNHVPWQLVAQRTGARLEFIPLDSRGRLNIEAAAEFFDDRLKLVAVTQMSNVLGTINPLSDIVRRARQAGAAVLVDGAQGCAHMPVDVRQLDCDFYAFSGHKMCAPTGIGVLYGKRRLLEAMPPFLGGGEMITSVDWRESKWNQLPWKFEAGTPSIAQAIGLGAAIEYLESAGMQAIHEHEADLVRYAWERLHDLPGICAYGPEPDERGGLIAFTLDDLHPHDIAQFLDQQGVAIRAGHHCAMPLHKHLGVAATARASFYLYNTRDEVDALLAALGKALKFFGIEARTTVTV